MKGSYLLILHLQHHLAHIPIGHLGVFNFTAGYYLYIGSAFGAGGLPARLQHHQRHTKKRPHWHIDYIRPYMHILESWSVSGTPPLERLWCTILTTTQAFHIPIPGFGASDSPCRAHLFYTATHPRNTSLAKNIFASLPLHTPDDMPLQIQIHQYENTAHTPLSQHNT